MPCFLIHPISILFSILELSVMFFLVLDCIIRSKQQGSNRRLIILAVLSIIYNLTSGGLPTPDLAMSVFFQTAIVYFFGTSLSLYFIYYLYEEFHFETVPFFDFRSVAIYVGIMYFGFFLLPYFITSDLEFSKKLFSILPSICAVVFIVYTSGKLFEHFRKIKTDTKARKRHARLRLIAAMCALISILCLPLLKSFMDDDLLKQIVTNMSFIAILWAYISDYIYQRKEELRLLATYGQELAYFRQQAFFRQQDLTLKEVEVARLVIEGLPYKEIGDMLFITDKTVSKHASNIYKKVGVRNRSEFILLVEHENTYACSTKPSELGPISSIPSG